MVNGFLDCVARTCPRLVRVRGLVEEPRTARGVHGDDRVGRDHERIGFPRGARLPLGEQDGSRARIRAASAAIGRISP